MEGLYLLMFMVVLLIIWINVKPQPEIKIMEKDKESNEWWETTEDEME